ncbi:MAG: stage V sporulation protein T, partial [Clostridia bacterium]|nr:stage V sporulation protein T [Clostridia bacterium]
REGDPLEIYTDREGEVIFKKYSPVGELEPFAAQICESVAKVSNCTVAVTDRDSVIAVSGPEKKVLQEKPLSAQLENIIASRTPYFDTEGGRGVLVTEASEKTAFAAVPIVVLGDITGCVLMAGENGATCTDAEKKLAASVAGFLGKQMDS